MADTILSGSDVWRATLGSGATMREVNQYLERRKLEYIVQVKEDGQFIEIILNNKGMTSDGLEFVVEILKLCPHFLCIFPPAYLFCDYLLGLDTLDMDRAFKEIMFTASEYLLDHEILLDSIEGATANIRCTPRAIKFLSSMEMTKFITRITP